MSQTRKEMAELVQRHQYEKWGWSETTEDLLSMPHMELCSRYWDALAFYKIDHHYFSLEDVPEPYEEMGVFIREKDCRLQYRFRCGEWVFVSDVPDSTFS